MKVIGFGHRSRMGKNTCSEAFAEYAQNDGKTVEVTSFAKPLKEACHIMFKGFGLQDAEYYEKFPEERNIKLSELNMTPVEIWIKVGTPLIRQQMHDDTWVRATLYPRDIDFLIISDVRFINEVNAIKKLEGKVIKIHNPRIPLRDSIADEALESFRDWDYSIQNHSDLGTLQYYVYELFKSIK